MSYYRFCVYCTKYDYCDNKEKSKKTKCKQFRGNLDYTLKIRIWRFFYWLLKKEDKIEDYCKQSLDLPEDTQNHILVNIYLKIKEIVISEGYKQEIESIESIPKDFDKEYFFREYCWVVINSGMKNKIAEKIFEKFWNNGDINFDEVNHPHKNKSIRYVFSRLDFIYNHFITSKNKLEFLKALSHIGDITKYHLARNLGLDYAKPDRHLTRIAHFLKYDDVQKFCKAISEFVDDRIGIVDLVLWRFATLFEDYLERIYKMLKFELKNYVNIKEVK